VTPAYSLVDEIREETPRAVKLLRKAGVTRIVMVTGDRQDVAETIGALLGVDEVLAEQRPQDKLAAIKESHSSGSTIMVGMGLTTRPPWPPPGSRWVSGARRRHPRLLGLYSDMLHRGAGVYRSLGRTRAVRLRAMVRYPS
jgi:hypothetical protein